MEAAEAGEAGAALAAGALAAGASGVGAGPAVWAAACEVPFRPTGDKPVFCNDCFRKDSGDSQPRGGGRFNRDGRTPQRSGPNYQDHFDAINQKLDHLLELVSAMKKPKVKKKEPADLE